MESEFTNENLSRYPTETHELIVQYLKSMNEKEKIAYKIAKNHLGTSFNIIKSIGYIEWKSKK